MSTARTALSSLFGTVNSTAITLTETVATIGTAVGMANSYITLQAEKQKLDHKVERAVYKNVLIENAAMQEAERKKSILAFCEDETNAKLFAEAFNQFSDILA